MRRLISLISLFLIAQNAAAQDTLWGATVGGGTAISPHYMGDDDYALNALPYLRLSYDDIFYASVPEGANIKLYDTGPFTVTANTKFVFDREEDGSAPFRVAGNRTNDLIGLGDVATSWELGGKISYKIGNISITSAARQAVSGHDGFVGDISASYSKAIYGYGPPIRVSFGPSLSFGDAQYMQTFFGINPKQSIDSGLSEFNASGGLYSLGLSLSAMAPVTNRSALFLQASLSQMTKDAKNSPLVKERGSPTQAFAGVFWVYSFGQDARRGRP